MKFKKDEKVQVVIFEALRMGVVITVHSETCEYSIRLLGCGRTVLFPEEFVMSAEKCTLFGVAIADLNPSKLPLAIADENKNSYRHLFSQQEMSQKQEKVELVKVPQFVADVIRILKGKWGDDLATSIDYKLYTEQFVHKWSFDERIRGWLQYASNQETFARAWMGEYEVEKEPLYYIIVIDSRFGYINLNLKTGAYITSANREFGRFKTKFTEQEIKELDERYWQFKVPVEEVEGE
ncbi:DUF1642 domain-containing protein [Listeria monocytogenes]|uniref:DUF1642 domain-containing protein n=1 Tax=Listeria monocytogenes TaxID=1639 RepID=UPI001F251F8D|nr:DUF1642 domain-containing protein [Listeria monocytogenes]MCF2016141.1 DUF1642 domain-containing protein [Listeria monocytogenes]